MKTKNSKAKPKRLPGVGSSRMVRCGRMDSEFSSMSMTEIKELVCLLTRFRKLSFVQQSGWANSVDVVIGVAKSI